MLDVEDWLFHSDLILSYNVGVINFEVIGQKYVPI